MGYASVATKYEPTITRHGIMDVQVCVPADWIDKQVIDFVKSQVGNTMWSIRKEGSKFLGGDPERAKCSDREGFVHIVVDFL